MSLQPVNLLSQPKLTHSINSLNLDISILNSITKPINLQTEFSSKTKPNNLSLEKLSLVLKKKNQKYHAQEQQKQETNEWLNQKGLNMKKLNQQIFENVKTIKSVSAQKEKKALIQGVDVSVIRRREQALKGGQKLKQYGFSTQLQEQFIAKQKQTALCKLIINSMKSAKPKHSTRDILRMKIIDQLELKDRNLNKTILDNVDELPYQKQQSQRIRLQYFNFAKCLAARGFDQSLDKLKDVRNFWGIVLQHVKVVQKSVYQFQETSIQRQSLPQDDLKAAQLKFKLKLKQKIMLKSLKLIQHQIDKTLGTFKESFQILEELTKDAERKNRNLKVWRNQKGQASWALTFILLKAGRIDQIKRVLQKVDKEFLKDLQQYQKSIDDQQPRTSIKTYDISKYNDNFYHQLVRILKGTPKFDLDILMGSNQTKIWLILRTLGIYRAQQDIEIQYQQMMKQIIYRESIEKEPISNQKVEEFLYLGIYREFLNFNQMIQSKQIDNQFLEFNQNDYFHLFTVINYFPQLWYDEFNRPEIDLQAKYTDALKRYIHKMIFQGCKQEIPSYLLLCPLSKIKDLAISLITTPDQFKQFDWKQLKDLLKMRDPVKADQLTKYLQDQVLYSLHLSTFEDLVFGSQKFRQKYSKHRCYIKILLSCIYFGERKRQLIQINEDDSELQEQMSMFYKLVQKAQLTQKVNEIEHRLYKDLEENSISKDYFEQVDLPFRFYNKLKKLSILLRNPIDQIDDLRNFDQKWYDGPNDRNKNCSELQSTQILLKFLEQQMNKTSIYVLYLELLIERVRIISSIDCDYWGFPHYIQLKLKNLNELNNYYKNLKGQTRKNQKYFSTDQKRKNQGKTKNPLESCEDYKRLVNNLNKALQI